MRLTGGLARLSGSSREQAGPKYNALKEQTRRYPLARRTLHTDDDARGAAATALGVHARARLRAGQQTDNNRVLRQERHEPVLEGLPHRRRKGGQGARRQIETVAPTKPDNIEEQTRLVEDWIVKKPDAFVFVPVDYKALVPSIQKANKAGIPSSATTTV